MLWTRLSLGRHLSWFDAACPTPLGPGPKSSRRHRSSKVEAVIAMYGPSSHYPGFGACLLAFLFLDSSIIPSAFSLTAYASAPGCSEREISTPGRSETRVQRSFGNRANPQGDWRSRSEGSGCSGCRVMTPVRRDVIHRRIVSSYLRDGP